MSDSDRQLDVQFAEMPRRNARVVTYFQGWGDHVTHFNDFVNVSYNYQSTTLSGWASIAEIIA